MKKQLLIALFAATLGFCYGIAARYTDPLFALNMPPRIWTAEIDGEVLRVKRDGVQVIHLWLKHLTRTNLDIGHGWMSLGDTIWPQYPQDAHRFDYVLPRPLPARQGDYLDTTLPYTNQYRGLNIWGTNTFGTNAEWKIKCFDRDGFVVFAKSEDGTLGESRILISTNPDEARLESISRDVTTNITAGKSRLVWTTGGKLHYEDVPTLITNYVTNINFRVR